jgi:O-antigen/teichoic acid export membrane protein
MQNLLLALLQVRSYNLIEVVNRTGYLAIIALLVAFHTLSVESAFISTLVLLLVSLAWAIWRLNDFVDTKIPAPSLTLFKANFNLGFRGYLISLLGFMVLRIDLLMVKYMLGTVQAGYYSVAAGIADYVLLLPTVVASILFPKLSASTDVGEKWRFAKRATLATGAILLPIALIAVFAGGPIITAVFGVAFVPAAVALRWLAPGIVALGLQVVMVQYLNSVGYPALLVAAWFVCMVLNVGLNWWVIPVYGITGASFVSSITYSLMCVLVLLIIGTGAYGQMATTLKAVPVES